MSTRATIAILDKNKAKSVYLHSDGYISWTGALLLDYYNTQEKAEELIALGSLSTLRERVKPLDWERHSFDNPLEDVTVAYNRDRGEELEVWFVEILDTDDERKIIQKLSDVSGSNYVYLFVSSKNQWFIGTTSEYLGDEKSDCPDAKPFVLYPLEKWFDKEDV